MNPLTPEQIQSLKSLTPEQQRSYNLYRESGITPERALTLIKEPYTKPVKGGDGILFGPKSLTSSIGAGLKEATTGGIREIIDDKNKYGGGFALGKAPLSIVAGLGRGVGEVVGGVLETADDLTGETVSEIVEPVVRSAAESSTGQKVIGAAERFNDATRGVAGDILDASILIPAGLAESVAKRILSKEATTILKVADEVVPPGGGRGKSLADYFKRGEPAPTTGPIVEADVKIPATQVIREAAEANAPRLTLKERTIGITPDVKGRLQEAGDDLVKQYIDISKTRNVTDTIVDSTGKRTPAPTPYGFGAQRAEQAATKLQELASDTGSVIGKTREKLGSYTATIDDVNRIESRLVSEAEKMNLTIKNGKVVRGRGIQTASEGDIKALQTIYDNFKVVKESPKLPNLIEFRSAVDQNIKFGKRASEVSDAIDPISRAIRGETADVAARIVGKTEAAELAKYSDFLDALGDLRSYTDRKAGGEYLLRLVSSGRGDEARRLVNIIREYTGIDLMNDATLMTLVTDLIGNSAQKNLFRQEITKAGADVSAILSGSPTTIAGRALDRGIDFLTDAEEILINAAKKK